MMELFGAVRRSTQASAEVWIIVFCIAALAIAPVMLRLVSKAYVKKKREALRGIAVSKVEKIEKDARRLYIEYLSCQEDVSRFGLNRTTRRSSSVVANAYSEPTKYLIKYSNIDFDFESLEKLENIHLFYTSYSRFCESLEKLSREVASRIPLILRLFMNKKKLPFWICDIEDVLFDVKYPYLKFLYVSSAGKTARSHKIVLNLDQIESAIEMIQGKIGKRGYSKHQRSRMTNDLREMIKKRDNYTCQKCGNNLLKEPNLLLEVDHIIPIAKGGKTEADNLQTLCWRCNREKGGK